MRENDVIGCLRKAPPQLAVTSRADTTAGNACGIQRDLSLQSFGVSNDFLVRARHHTLILTQGYNYAICLRPLSLSIFWISGTQAHVVEIAASSSRSVAATAWTSRLDSRIPQAVCLGWQLTFG